MEKELFCPLPCSAAGRVAIGHPICTVSVPHMMVIIHQNCRLYCIPVFIAIIAFSGWIVNVCQEEHVSLVLPHHSRQVTPGRYSNVTMFQSQCLGLRCLGMPFLCSLTVPQQKIFFWAKSSYRSGEEKSCPCTVYGQFLLYPLSD